MNKENFTFTSLSNILMDFLPKEHQWKLKIFQNWEEIIGNLKNIVAIERIEEDYILLSVLHSSWAQELNFLQDIIKSKINSVVGEEKIKAIKFRVGLIKNKNQRPKNSQPPKNSTNLKSKNLSKINFIKECSSKVDDIDLKKVLEAYFLRCLNQNKGE